MTATELYMRDLRRFPSPLTAEEEANATPEELVRHNLRFALGIASRYQRCGLDLDDLIQEASTGLIIAAKKFDSSRGVRFISYAVWWIRQCILLAIGEAPVVALPANKRRDNAAFLREEQNSKEEMSPSSKPPFALSFVSLDRPHDASGLTALGTVADHRPWPDQEAEEKERRERVDRAIRSLGPRESDMVRRYFGLKDGETETLEQIGDDYGLSRERVRQVLEHASGRLRNKRELQAL